MAETKLHVVGAGMNADDLWMNHYYLEGRIAAAEGRIRELDALVARLRKDIHRPASGSVGENDVAPVSIPDQLGTAE